MRTIKLDAQVVEAISGHYDEALRLIEAHDPERPFFLYLPFLAPHEPLEAPAELVAKYGGLGDDRKPARSPSNGSAP